MNTTLRKRKPCCLEIEQTSQGMTISSDHILQYFSRCKILEGQGLIVYAKENQKMMTLLTQKGLVQSLESTTEFSKWGILRECVKVLSKESKERQD